MGANFMYLLKQDGSICGGFCVNPKASTIQDVIVDQNWEELLTRREHRIIGSVQLSPMKNANKEACEISWRMELLPLDNDDNDQNKPAFCCMVDRRVAHHVEEEQTEITNLRTIIDAMPFGVAVIRRDKHVYIMNQAALNLAGYASMEEFAALKRPCQETFCPAPKGQCPVWDKGQLFDKTERPFMMRDGTKIHVLKTAVPVCIEGETMMLEGLIDLRKQKDLERLAYTDPLTGILNRKGLRERFDSFSNRVAMEEESYTVLMFDLDDFKGINDTYGHFAGDNMLRFFVQSMKQELQDDDIFCRWGGDEFLIITAIDIHECVQKVQRVIKNTKVTPFQYEEWSHIALRFSVGIADFEPGMTLEEIVHKADGYMYHAKRGGIGIYYAPN